MAELKPCPFCGGEAVFRQMSYISTHIGAGFSYYIECSNCKCTPIQISGEMSVYLNKYGEIEITEPSKQAKQRMIDKWNTRTQNDKE